MPTFVLRPREILLIAATIVLGLIVDARSGILGQTLVSAVVWGLLFYLLGQVRRGERRALIACLLIATLGELVLSLLWGVYRYRLGNIPLFVPPGHVLLFLLGLALAQRLSEAAAWALIAGAAVYSLAAAALGLDTLGAVLFLLLAVAALVMPGHRRLYASTFVLALGLELLGTWLGNWSWSREVPLLPLLTTNPPLAAGALYSSLDALVAAALLFPRQSSASGPLGPGA